MSERSKFWLSHLSAIEAEGITTKAYAEREGLSPQALYQWRKRLVAGGRESPRVSRRRLCLSQVVTACSLRLR